MKYCLLLFTFLLGILTFGQGDNCNQSLYLPDVNDYCSGQAAFTNVGSTASGFAVASCWGASQTEDVWFSFIATGNDVLISVSGNGSDGTMSNPRIALYSGNCAGTLTEYACTNSPSNDVSQIYEGGMVPGQTYLIRVSTTSANEGTFKLCVNSYTQPNNPGADCGGAAYLCDKSTVSVATFSGGGTNIYEPEWSSCMSNENNSVWFYFRCNAAGTFTFDVTPSNPTQDIDYIFYELSGTSVCGARTVKRCNTSSCLNATGSTGMSASDGDVSEDSGCDPGENAYCSSMNLVAGKYYAILIDNASSNSGFSLSFGGTATFTGPDPNITSTNLTICTGQTVTFNGGTSVNSAGGLNWVFSSGSSPTSATGAGPHVVTYPSAGSYVAILNATDATGCQDTEVANITVNNCGCTVTASNTGPVCAGATFNLNATAVAGATGYSWSGPGGYSSTSQNPTGVIAPSVSGSYTVTVTTPTSTCTSTTNLTVNTAPTINAGSDVAICTGASSVLTATGPAGTTYSWNNGASQGGSVSPAVTTTYTVTGTNAGCTSTDQVIVTVNALPTVNAGADVNVCTGQNVILTASGPAGATYSWTPSATNGVSFVPSGSALYTVSCTDVNGCVNSDQLQVTVGGSANITASSNVTICQGASTTLTASGGANYAWNNGAGSGASVTVSPASTTIYTVIGTDVSGCQGTAQVTVTINPVPVINAGTDQTICTGTSVVLTASGASTIVWDNGVSDGVSFTPVSTTTYTATGTDAIGCVGSDQVTISVINLASVNAGVDQTICAGQTIILSGSGANTYTWNNGVTNGVAFTPPNGTTTYTVTGTSAGGCTKTDSVIITVVTSPVISFTADTLVGCVGDIINFTNTSPSSVSCVWSFSNGLVLNSCGTIPIQFNSAGIYDVSLTIINAGGCSGTLTKTAFIEIFALPIADFDASSTTLSTTNTMVHFTNTSLNATSYLWTFGDNSASSNILNPDHTFPSNEGGSYLVGLYAYNAAGCSDFISKIINVKEDVVYYVPNTFTPDEDEYNDNFGPVFTSGFDPFDFELLIFNRWGELIFESHDATIGWDGTYGSKIVAEGTYTWKIEFKTTQSDERRAISGHVNLIK